MQTDWAHIPAIQEEKSVSGKQHDMRTSRKQRYTTTTVQVTSSNWCALGTKLTVEPDPNSQIRLSGSRLKVAGAMVPLHPRNLPAKSTGQTVGALAPQFLRSLSEIVVQLWALFLVPRHVIQQVGQYIPKITPVVIGDLIGFSREG